MFHIDKMASYAKSIRKSQMKRYVVGIRRFGEPERGAAAKDGPTDWFPPVAADSILHDQAVQRHDLAD